MSSSSHRRQLRCTARRLSSSIPYPGGHERSPPQVCSRWCGISSRKHRLHPHCHHRRSSASTTSTLRIQPGSDPHSTCRIRATCPRSYSQREVLVAHHRSSASTTSTVRIQPGSDPHSTCCIQATCPRSYSQSRDRHPKGSQALLGERGTTRPPSCPHCKPCKPRSSPRSNCSRRRRWGHLAVVHM